MAANGPRTSVALDEDARRYLVGYANFEGISQGEVIRRALAAFQRDHPVGRRKLPFAALAFGSGSGVSRKVKTAVDEEIAARRGSRRAS